MSTIQSKALICRQAVGIAYLLRCTVEADVKSGQLEVVLPERQLERVPLHFLHAFGRTPPLRARLFMEFVSAKIAAYAT
jgi:DNA-binding transcriptional LysR family regulator